MWRDVARRAATHLGDFDQTLLELLIRIQFLALVNERENNLFLELPRLLEILQSIPGTRG